MSEAQAKAARGARRWNFLEALLFTLGVADGVGTLLIYAWGLSPVDRGNVRVAFFCVLAGAFTGTVVHELGHAIAALICGWRIIVFTVRPFAWRIPAPDLVMARGQTFRQFAGFVTAVPGSAKTLTVGRWVAFIAGGPLASLVFALYLGGMAWVLWNGGAVSPKIHFLVAICAGFAAHSAMVCIRTLVPRRGASFSSDGAKLLKALIKWEKLAEGRAGVWVIALMKYRIRPRDLPAWMVEAVHAEPAGARIWNALEISRMLDGPAPDVAVVRGRLEAHRQIYGPSEWLCACDAFVAAMYEDDLARAERALGEWQGSRAIPELTAAALAAFNARLGNPDETRRYLDEMDRILRLASPFRDDCYGDIKRNVEGLLRATRQSRVRRAEILPEAAGSVPGHF